MWCTSGVHLMTTLAMCGVHRKCTCHVHSVITCVIASVRHVDLNARVVLDLGIAPCCGRVASSPREHTADMPNNMATHGHDKGLTWRTCPFFVALLTATAAYPTRPEFARWSSSRIQVLCHGCNHMVPDRLGLHCQHHIIHLGVTVKWR